MKSAYEKALERAGGPIRKLTDEQKEEIAEIDSKYKAKIAQVKLMADEELRKTGRDPKKGNDIRERRRNEIARLEEKMERDKEKVRDSEE